MAINSFKKQFFDDGFVIAKNVVPKNLILNYVHKWIQVHLDNVFLNEENWSTTQCHKTIQELQNIVYCDALNKYIQLILNKQVKPFFVQTSWSPTTLDWHRDIINYEIAAWISLDEIKIESGPFRIIPKSHLKEFCIGSLKNGIYEYFTFLANSGDVLFWHPLSVHSGSKQNGQKYYRKSIIVHYK